MLLADGEIDIFFDRGYNLKKKKKGYAHPGTPPYKKYAKAKT